MRTGIWETTETGIEASSIYMIRILKGKIVEGMIRKMRFGNEQKALRVQEGFFIGLLSLFS